MATAYKNQANAVETLTARVFADGVEVHLGHRLRDCTRFQWFHDFLDGNGGQAIVGAISDTYDVDLSDISNSGEYYCEITIGNTGDCNQRTQPQRISIINCNSDVANLNPVPFGGSSTVQVSIEHAHFETPIFSDEGLDWITFESAPQCPIEDGVCLTPATFAVAANSGANQSRQGQVSLTIGEFVCYYNVLQDFEQTTDGAGTEPLPADGPFINLSENGPVLVGTFFGNITVTADVGTIGGTGTEIYTVDWFDDNGGTGTGLTYEVQNPSMVEDVIVTGTVTDNNGNTATATITVSFFSIFIPSQTTTVGDITGQVNWRVLETLGPSGSPPGVRRLSGNFTVGGDGNWDFVVNQFDGWFGANQIAATVTGIITGPGVDETIVVTRDNPTETFEATGRVGQYAWSLEISDVLPDTSYANGSIIIYPRLF